MAITQQEYIEIRKLVLEEIKNAKFDKTYSATVVAVNGILADIQLAGSNVIITDIKNKSGETLEIGNEVKLTAFNNNFNDLTITIKK